MHKESVLTFYRNIIKTLSIMTPKPKDQDIERIERIKHEANKIRESIESTSTDDPSWATKRLQQFKRLIFFILRNASFIAVMAMPILAISFGDMVYNKTLHHTSYLPSRTIGFQAAAAAVMLMLARFVIEGERAGEIKDGIGDSVRKLIFNILALNHRLKEKFANLLKKKGAERNNSIKARRSQERATIIARNDRALKLTKIINKFCQLAMTAIAAYVVKYRLDKNPAMKATIIMIKYGLPPNSEYVTVQKWYRKQCLKLHPDRHGGKRDEEYDAFEKDWQIIKEFYENRQTTGGTSGTSGTRTSMPSRASIMENARSLRFELDALIKA